MKFVIWKRRHLRTLTKICFQTCTLTTLRSVKFFWASRNSNTRAVRTMSSSGSSSAVCAITSCDKRSRRRFPRESSSCSRVYSTCSKCKFRSSSRWTIISRQLACLSRQIPCCAWCQISRAAWQCPTWVRIYSIKAITLSSKADIQTTVRSGAPAKPTFILTVSRWRSTNKTASPNPYWATKSFYREASST